MENLPTIELPDAETKSNRRFFLRYWIAFGIAGLLIVTGLIRMIYGNTDLEATRINDKAFAAGANQVCLRYLPGLMEKQPQRGETLSNKEAATRIRESAAVMTTMKNELAGLNIAREDQLAVSQWLKHWNAYITAGNEYADALDANDKSRWSSIGEASVADSKQITAFALVNNISDCALRTNVPQSSGI